MNIQSVADVGMLRIFKVDNRGFTPEELAEQALGRIISIGDTSDPVLRAQAHAFRDQLRVVLTEYMHRAIQSHMCTLTNKLKAQGQEHLLYILEK
jgi:hypothetical protein